MSETSTTLSQAQVVEKTRLFLLNRVAMQIDKAEKIHPDYGSLWRSIEKLIDAGGKYMRPYLVALSYQATSSSKQFESILPALGSMELLHLSLLIHDDIIDRDDVRYGIRNVTGQRKDEYLLLIKDEHDREHFARSAAVLAGDLTLSLAHQLLAESEVSPDILRTATAVFNEGVFRVAGGELLDTESAFRGEAAASPSLIAHEKTASYSVCLPLRLGAALAGAPTRDLDQLNIVGSLLGEAYQLQDDILGTFGDEALTGKPVDGDIREGKRTFLIKHFYDFANQKQQSDFSLGFNRHDASADDIERARQALYASGAVDATETLIDELTAKALVKIEQLGWPQTSIKQLEALAKKSARRKK